MRIPAWLLLAFSAWVCAEVQAQSSADRDLPDGYEPATPLIIPEPKYPESAWFKEWEGWITLSYIITAEGKVSSIVVEDSSAQEEFEEAALESVQRRLYKPAMRNGVPIEESVRSSTIVFFYPYGTGISRSFETAFDEISKYITDGDLDSARTAIEDIRASSQVHLDEDAWYWWTRFLYSAAAGNAEEYELIEYLRKVTAFSRSRGPIVTPMVRRPRGHHLAQLPTDVSMEALDAYFVLSVRTNNFGSAIRTFELMRDADWAKSASKYERTLNARADTYEQLLGIIDGDSPLLQRSRVGNRGNAIHELSRRLFYLADVEGSLDSLSVRCDFGTSDHEYRPGAVLRIPEDWGDCSLYVLGDAGTTFALVELSRSP